jgi:hypothetical protein
MNNQNQVYAWINAEAALVRAYNATSNTNPNAVRLLTAARDLRELINHHCNWQTGADLKPIIIRSKQ